MHRASPRTPDASSHRRHKVGSQPQGQTKDEADKLSLILNGTLWSSLLQEVYQTGLQERQGLQPATKELRE